MARPRQAAGARRHTELILTILASASAVSGPQGILRRSVALRFRLKPLGRGGTRRPGRPCPGRGIRRSEGGGKEDPAHPRRYGSICITLSVLSLVSFGAQNWRLWRPPGPLISRFSHLLARQDIAVMV